MNETKSTFISKEEQKKIEIFFKKILEALKIKLYVYKLLILPSQQIALYRIRKIIKNSSPSSKNTSGKKILFHPIDARYGLHTYIEGGIAKALQVRGSEVKMLICGGVLKTCPGHFTIKKPRVTWQCENCVSFSRKFYETVGLPYVSYRDYITKEDIETITKKVNEMSMKECKNFVHKGVKVGFHAFTSANRYFIGAKTEEELYNSVFRSELISAIISTDVAEKIIADEKPDIMVNSHGCYSTWGSFSELFMNKNIKVYIWGGGGHKKDTLIFERHDIGDCYTRYYEEARKKRALDKNEEEELKSFLDDRMTGIGGDTSLYGFSTDKTNDLKKMFDIDKYKKTYVLFSNLPWDSSLLKTNKGFKDVYEWVSCTIELFKEKPNLQLIIKIHPSEKVHESKNTVMDYINEKYDILPKNIKIIPPDGDISPYSLLPFIDVGIVYNGTIGLEMAIKNIPVVATGIAPYSEKGFTYDISTKKEYSEILFSDITTLPNQVNLAKSFAHFYFIKSLIPRSFIYYNSFLNLGWNIKSLEDFKPGKNKHLDKICNYILHGGIYQDW
jgi:hypothetical protein